MQESLITKKIIAYSLKKNMESTPFQKVSIRQIMETAEIRRQTFYDHFQDKFELLAWIYQQDISENISDFLDYEKWRKVVFRILDYFNRNQIFYCNALAVSEQNSFDHYFLKHTEELIKTIITEIAHEEDYIIDENELTFYALFYAHAFVGLTKEWLLNGCQTPTETLAQQTTKTLEQSIKGLLTNP